MEQRYHRHHVRHCCWPCRPHRGVGVRQLLFWMLLLLLGAVVAVGGVVAAETAAGTTTSSTLAQQQQQQQQQQQDQRQLQRQEQGVDGVDASVSERDMLLELYEATGGIYWNNAHGWDTAAASASSPYDYCNWYGVYCSNEVETPPIDDAAAGDDAFYNATLNEYQAQTDDTVSNRRRRLQSSSPPTPVIVGLDLSNNFLVGTTPAHLWSVLSKLEYFDVSWNDGLVVDVTNLGGGVSTLQDLRVAGTATSLSFLLTQLAAWSSSSTKFNLTSLHASHLQLDITTTATPTTNLPIDQVGSLTTLRSLHLANCSLRGSIFEKDSSTDNNNNNPLWIMRLDQLQELDLYHNQITGTLPSNLFQASSSPSLNQLQSLVLSENQLQGKLVDAVTTWKSSLQYVYLDHNQFTGPLPDFANTFSSHLQVLTLQENLLTGGIPDNFLSNLATAAVNTTTNNSDVVLIHLAGNLLSGTVPSSLTALQNVPLILDMTDNHFTHIDDALCHMNRWMQGQVQQLGCSALLCPIGTYQPALGYATNVSQKEQDQAGASDPGTTCWTCPTNTQYWGSTTCANTTHDLELLLELYEATNGTGWYHQDGWKDAAASAVENPTTFSNFCTWYGITCWDLGDARDGRVRAIRLPYNHLVGTLPDSIYQLAQLTVLDVSSNTQLTVSLQGVLSSPHLQVLNMGHTDTWDFSGLDAAALAATASGTDMISSFHHLLANNLPLNGPIPTEIFALTELKTLSLASCQLTGNVPSLMFEHLTELQELYLYDNVFQGTLTEVMFHAMTNLRILSLAQNALTGSIPDVSALKDLQAFSLFDQITKGGGLVGALPSFDNHTGLTNILLAKNQLNGTIPSTLLSSMDGNTSSLVVDVSHNRLTGTVPSSLARLTHMNLYLEDNDITHVDNNLCELDDWMGGAVGTYGCSGILCPAGTAGGRRQFDDMICDPCQTTTGQGTSQVMGQTQCGNVSSTTSGSGSGSSWSQDGMTERSILQRLYSSCGGDNWKTKTNWNDATVDICDWYGISCDDTGSVTNLVLGSNKLSGIIPTELFWLPQLKRLSLFGNPVAFSFSGIENAQNLQELVLDETGLRTLQGVGKALGLRLLNVRFNQLAGPIPNELVQLTALQSLGLSGNDLSGTIPSWFSELSLLQTLLIADNKLLGPLPDFEGLSFLQYLDLSENLLTGTVPKSFLPSLLVADSQTDNLMVDLSKNRLSGTLSSDFVARGYIDLQDNRIEAIDNNLCSSWSFQCDGILCPVGTFNSLGRQTDPATPCQPCPEAKYMGSTRCGNNQSSASRLLGLGWMISVALSFLLIVSLV